MINPLTDQHLQALNSVLRNAPEYQQFLQACKNCGHDVTAFQEQHAAQVDYAHAVKKQFFPQES